MSDLSSTSVPSGPSLDLKQTLTFTFAGRPVEAIVGQSIAAALYAAGVRIFSRSFKYHRPRGLMCVSGDCPNCLMQVDGRPNVRTCVEPARAGQVVKPQNAWPSLDFDALRIFDYLSWFLPVGFYYRKFHKPRWMWPLVEPMIRRLAGLGRIDVNVVPDAKTEAENLHAEVCVVGGGPAGLAAAIEIAASGARVLLLERQPWLGGHLLFDSLGRETILADLVTRVRAQQLIEVRAHTTVFGVYEENLLGAFSENRLLKIRARHIIVCTGGRQRPFVFGNNDVPGIFLSDGLLRLARLHGVKAGQRVVVVTDNDNGVGRLPEQLRSLGFDVAAVVDQRPALAGTAQASTPWPVLAGHVIVKALGNKRLKGVRVARFDSQGRIDAASADDLACDTLCVASRRWPANELLLQGGVRFRPQAAGCVPGGAVPGLSGAGAAVGVDSLDQQIHDGRQRGAETARSLGHSSGIANTRNAEPACETPKTSNICAAATGSGKQFICFCEDVTEKDLARAIDEGFDHIETLKRYSTVNMGPCQGKMCGQNAAEAFARLTQRDLASVGTTTSRPPMVPVEMCVLAADRHHHPVRRTPLHHWHEAAGATWMDAGLWKRPERYGDPLAEVRAVRERVGLIDVSTLGKIELFGPDAAQLLERVYLNKWADLRQGRVRYGALCTEEGILFDDGVGARRGAEHFYLTATTGNADAVYQWFERWIATWGLNATAVNQTGALAALNLAGPRAREVLAKLTSIDLSPDGFPYMALREGDVAGVPCILMRIGFVGELGYEIHCPSAMAAHVWESLVAAGKEFDLQPFGVEAQRILRLEKGHIILGVDTDALSNPLEAGLEWMVRFDKPTFHGRGPLERLMGRGARSRLVGIQLRESPSLPDILRDLEGCQVIQAGRPVGRVTSARRSPTLNCALGLAWVPAASATRGTQIVIRCNEHDVTAEVVSLPFYDPDMKRVKS